MIATAPGKLIVSGEYAVLDGAPALVLAVDRRVVARVDDGARGSSPFLLAVADELARRRGPDDAAARAALAITVDSAAFYDGPMKLGLGSSAAVTVAATARALGATAPLGPDAKPGPVPGFLDEVLAVALAAHAMAQGAKGARGSGADIAASTYGGAIVFTAAPASVDDADAAAAPRVGSSAELGVAPSPAPRVVRTAWPASVTLLPFFTGVAADTATLVARVAAARASHRGAVEAALAAIAEASRAACQACSIGARTAARRDSAAARDGEAGELAATGLIGALALAGGAVERLGAAAGVELVPACVRAARAAMARFGGTAKTTGAGGGDIGIAVIPATADEAAATRALIEAGCRPLALSVDNTGVDLRPNAA
jgi:phosphomevalonate kinase